MTANHATATTYAEWLVETESPATASRANLARAYLELRERVVEGGQRAIERIDRTLDEMLTNKSVISVGVKLDGAPVVPVVDQEGRCWCGACFGTGIMHVDGIAQVSTASGTLTECEACFGTGSSERTAR